MDLVILGSVSISFVLFFAMVGFTMVKRRDHVKGIAPLIPLIGIYIGIWFIASNGPLSWLMWIESILLLFETLYFIGPFRVSGWGWPGGGRQKIPHRVSTIFVIVTVIGTIVGSIGFFMAMGWLYGYDSLSFIHVNAYTTAGAIVGWILAVAGMIAFAAAIAGLIFLTCWGLYSIVVSCFTLDRKEKKGVITNHWIDRGGSHIVTFDSDTNGYHVSPKLYEKLTERNKGAAYSYTVVTGLGKRQFIRTPPVLIPSQGKDYSSYESTDQSAALGGFDLGNRPVERLLGGDGVVAGLPLGLEVEHGTPSLVDVDVRGELGVRGDDRRTLQ